MANPNIVNVNTILGETFGTQLTTTTTTVLVANSSTSNSVYKINSVFVANKDGTNAADVTVEYFDGTNAHKLASTISVPADASLSIIDKNNSFYLKEGESIRGGASADGDLDIVISYENIQ
jgi:hypothetical protein